MEINNLNHLISQGRKEFIEKTIQIDENGIILKNSNFDRISELVFSNCVFKGGYLEFKNISKDKFTVLFDNCCFEIELKFYDCSFNNLIFKNTIKINKIEVIYGKYDFLCFNNTSFDKKKQNKLNGVLSFDNLTIKDNVLFDYLNLSDGNFEFSNITVLESENSIINFGFSDFQNAIFNKNTFNVEANFNELQTTKYCEFDECKFQKTYFSCLRFGKKDISEIRFINCKFSVVAVFHYIYGDIYGKLSFDDCKFEKNVYFNNSKLYFLSLVDLLFSANVSFQDMFLDKILIEDVIFEKQVNFDDIQIKQIDQCDRKTIRAIKLQLQKAENKIDYNRFRVFEFNAYRKDLKKDGNKLRVIGDRVILWISKFVSNYGNNWIKAFCITLFFGSILFLLFYSVENRNQSIDVLSYDNWSRFISGFIRFFLVTDFFNPLANDRTYLTNPLSWLFFIIGKIVISFGLYEMIQSFRKFKA